MKPKMEKYVAFMLYGLSISLFMIMTVLAFNNSIWKDEVFDLNLIQHPYSYFVFSNRDSAPPIHFIILKFGVELLHGLFPFLSEIICAKLTSLIPYLLLIICSLTKLRKRYGLLSSAFFSFLIISMPKMLTVSIEIRQYSWAVFMGVIWFIYLGEFIEKQDVKSCIISTILGVLMTLIHYYACLAVVCAYIILFFVFFKSRCYSALKKILGMMLGSCLLFLPWLLIAARDIWSDANVFDIILTKRDILPTLTYGLITDTNKFGIGYGTAFIFVIFVIVFFVYMCKEKDIYLTIGLLIPFFVGTVGILVSFYVAPCFWGRYIIPSMGCFWLAFALCVGKIDKYKFFRIVIILFCLFVGGINLYKNVKEEIMYKNNFTELEAYMNDIPKNAIIVSNDHRVVNCLSYYLDNEMVILRSEDEFWEWEIDAVLKEDNSLIYMETIESKNDLAFEEMCREKGKDIIYNGEYGLEYIMFDIYAVKN